MIRPATADDIPAILVLGRKFFDQAKWAEIVEWDEASVQATLDLLLTSHVLLVLEKDRTVVGMAGALIYPFYFNIGHITGQEVFWWVEPDHRNGSGRSLREALESAARAKGARSFTMISVEHADHKPEAMARAYRMAGYVPSERCFIKSFEGL
jgi:hypothetical protein